ncbi:precorrin-6A synthase (deacetylating) [Cognatishimia sp. 1_MG-2023]|uniref:precorrin-6A synthase (deacetylating) n=1 Tax=Cognatishimia sp. 1_MG-2023 TaxID=3062642 RepID=UPI0026E4888E|nr:precorrin-6A synthase (deacetylating) [Cognatishimia sp. 1_MG-2023]MDO6726331.1 precorrin-6A synthase (deacetylating) [Cognatishimia sp. 1_MG-2023]
MIKLSLVGIGSGNPDHLTLQAIKTLEAADVILLPRKGDEKTELADLRRGIVAEVLQTTPKVVEFDYPIRDADSPKYLDGVNVWHDALAQIWSRLIADHAGPDAHVALMVWGDPSLYDSTLRIADRLLANGLEAAVEVVPGITSLQMLTAAHAIPLNALGAPVMITTGRQLRDHGWPVGVDTVAVMLDGLCSFQHVMDQDTQIWWGAYVGMPQQILRAGALADVCDDIIETRAKARDQNGWVMDIYLLKRGSKALA